MDELLQHAEVGRDREKRVKEVGTHIRVSLGVVAVLEPVLVHDPVGLLAVGSPSPVEDEGLPHPDLLLGVPYALVPPRRLPEPRIRRSVRPRAGRVLPILVAEEVPLVLGRRPDPASFCRCNLMLRSIVFENMLGYILSYIVGQYENMHSPS